MDRTKIQLSPFEMDLLNNPAWILTKNLIIKKAQTLLEEVQQNIFDYTKQHPAIFPPEVMAVSPKISRGENYKGLPWLILDYPRHFEKGNIFAIRSMFWWGNFFSTTLHLSGQYKLIYTDSLLNSYDQLCAREFYSCISEHPWHHHFEAENYLLVKEFSQQEFTGNIQSREFIKLSQKLPFSEWDNAINVLSENFTGIVKLIG